jgi:hypothetical protein
VTGDVAEIVGVRGGAGLTMTLAVPGVLEVKAALISAQVILIVPGGPAV